jgi:hypothetical protein
MGDRQLPSSAYHGEKARTVARSGNKPHKRNNRQCF